MFSDFSARMVGLGRVELPTSSLGNCCSIHLSYSPARLLYCKMLTDHSIRRRGFVDRARSRWMCARISCAVFWGDLGVGNRWMGPGGWEVFADGDSCCRIE